MSAPHLLIRASAGTGKTYALTTRYIERLAAGARPESLLATTFTRKAAREILERVLERLAEAAASAECRARLSSAIGREISQAECVAHLGSLVRHFDRVRIGTLDAVFVDVARRFAMELGLPAAWRIASEAEDEDLVAEAIARALDRRDDVEWLVLLRDLQRADADSGVHASLARLLTKGRAVHAECEPGAWTRVVPTQEVPEALRADAARRLEALAVPLNKNGTESADWRNARAKCIDCIANDEWDAFLDIGLIKRVVEGGAVFSRHPIEPEHRTLIELFLDHILHLRTKALALQNRATGELLDRLDRTLRTLKSERGLFSFDDFTRALSSGESSVWSRLGGRIDHLLLDEFQDTSPIQWRTLAPLADAVIGTVERSAGSPQAARSFFCVGDVKQSIYGWREAEPRLMQSLESRYPTLTHESLNESRRSSKVVLDAVNQVFSSIASNAAFARKSSEAELAAANDFQSVFTPHAPAYDLAGSVTLHETAADDDDGCPALQAAVVCVQDALERDAGRSVAVLVRRGKHIGDLIHRLQALGIDASGEGGNPLTDSAIVQAVLSLLTLADHPADSAAAFHVATSDLGAIVDLVPGASSERRSEVARTVRSSVAREGLGTYVRGLVEAVRARASSFDRRRLAALVDQALGFESRAPFRLSAFVDHVRREPVENPGGAAVRVMTVHKSKGLEFDVVVLPELDGNVRKRSDGYWTERDAPADRIRTATHTLPVGVAARHDVLKRLAVEKARRGLLEELCVLYVAMTRAKHELHMIVPVEKEKSEALTLGAIVRAALAPDVEATDGVLWSAEHAAAAKDREPAKRAAPPREPAIMRFRAPDRASAATTRSPSSAVPRPPRVHALLRADDRARVHGILVHRWLAEVEWLETFDKQDAQLEALGRAMGAGKEEVRGALATFRAALERTEVIAVLSREQRAAAEIEVWRERRFAVLLQDGELWSGAFDRVHLTHEAGRTSSAVIFDFKTGGDAERYAPQMDAYRRVLAKVTGLDPRAIETRIVMIAR